MNEIHIDSTLVDQKLISTLTVPKALRKYFNSLKFFAYYDAPLREDTSILNIPLISAILPVAWLTGTNLRVERLDKKFVEAMNTIRHEFNLMYPRGRFSTNIIVEKLVQNKTQSKETALLFSGGVDSTYSLISNINLKPRLIMFSGVQHYQLYPLYEKHEQTVKKTYLAYAKQQGLEINFIKTNIIGIVNESRFTHDFHKILRGAGLWLALQFPLVLLGLPAPLSIGRFNRLLIAASVDPNHAYEKYPHASQPSIDEKFAWADLRVKHDGYIHRFIKTKKIAKYLKKNKYELDVCNVPPPDRLNCSSCEKCFRTIAPLVLEGIDPNNCGFEVKRSTFTLMRLILEKKKFSDLVIDSFWKRLQTMIPEKMETDLFGSRNFFIWLKNLNINLARKKVNWYEILFNSLPYPLSLLFDAILYSIRKHLFVKSYRIKDPWWFFVKWFRSAINGEEI